MRCYREENNAREREGEKKNNKFCG